LLALRYLSLLALLTSCSIYSESLLDGAADEDAGGGGTRSIDRGGSGGSGSKASTTGGSAAGSDAASGTAGKAAGGSGSNVAGGGTGNETSGGSGGDTMGGVPPSGGSAGSPQVVLPTGVDLLDDMEDGNFYLAPTPPRFGYWYVASDKTMGSTLPEIEKLIAKLDPARSGSTQAVHFAASGFTGWGASVGFSFTDSANKPKAYDAGAAKGLVFWVRGSVKNDAKLRVIFPSTPTVAAGKLCGGPDQGQCLDHFGTQVSVTSEWTRVPIAFASLRQAGWGALIESGFDTKQMLGIEWTSDLHDLDVWIDDPSFAVEN
jgi:hypothetical protein